MMQHESIVGQAHDQKRRAVRQALECAELAGIEFVARPPKAAPPHAAANAAVDPSSGIDKGPGTAVRSPTTPSDSAQSSTHEGVAKILSVIQDEVSRCTCCAELAAQRTRTVFGVGNPTARLCFLGEAPGADEDRLGEPFVGRAGQLLDKILAACTLTREEVYILNVLKCRPPQNRTPALEEVENCRKFFERQLELIQPEFICCLGLVAAANLLRTKSSLGRLRGEFHDWRGMQVMVTYHPAYLLRNPSMKAETWKDMQMLMRAMNIPLAS